MKNIMSIEELEIYREQLKDNFRKWVTTENYDRWADTFEIENIDEKSVVIAYNGAESIKAFKKECKMPLFLCIYSIIGDGKKIRIIKKKKRMDLAPKTRKNITAARFFAAGMVFVCLATAVIVIMFSYIGNRTFRETFHIAGNIKVDNSIRVIQISDLHGSSYGRDNRKLLDRVGMLRPDIIVCTGDIVDSVAEDTDYAVNLAQELSKIAPAYYIYGNNEVEGVYDFNLNKEELDKKFGFDDTNRDETALLKIEDTFEQKIESAGMKVLKNEKDTIRIKSMNVDVYGVLTSNPSSFWSYTEKSFADYIYENTDNIKITAVHEPFIFQEFHPDFWGDLMVCGHTHGGIIRVPLLGPLFTKEDGLFPERGGSFVYGRYNVEGGPLFVSGGLENNNILRINNEPELVIIDVNKF